MLIAIISSLTIVGFLLGLIATRYFTHRKRRQCDLKNSTYSLSSCDRRKFASMSFDSLVPSPPVKSSLQTNTEVNETSRIIKSSFSWPEGTLPHHQQQEQQQGKDDCLSTISNSSTMEQIYQSASLTFTLRWDPNLQSLFVRILNARDLLVYRRNRQPAIIDSYVRIELIATKSDQTQELLQSMRTHIIKKNSNPVYDELFEFPNLHQTNLSLLFTILTYDTFTRDEILGEVTFPVILPDGITENALESTETTFIRDITPRHKQLNNQQLGQMLISLCYQPTDSTITLIVLKASNLPRISTTRLINPYFKIYMFYKGQRIVKKRSTIKRTTQCPVYNECFTFHLPDNDLRNIYFDIILFDYDHHMKHEPIGTFSIGNNTGETNQHWLDVCQRQISKQIAQWYQLKPFNVLNY
ncbi:unnamed protein product [Adineta ricciae]|uniref:C2 domain-containing protein n=1 Tax=Adineta ricciae TaxID=249248 RepID=A0A815FSC1_ADIRI|nr:unnamed protein product [Adineta ricciae]CAF1330709.1 unnamed protein product [Adineta ricciae]